ncbi:MAG: radical SAM protein [Gammaproteobacteria bacterium]|jgi:magnesium-protoporphyrin IX monomethyl ester (oxidative) cyclase|nr:radical SAM protein [Gammaproteobacteria bacterium]MBT7479439.1 radical SAM protein [Gammaproteobacteria bacterium]
MKKVSNRILLQKSISRSKSSKEDVKLSDLYVEGERRYNKVLLVKSPATLWSGGGGSINANIAEVINIPLGIGYLASSLREGGYQVEMFDPQLDLYFRDDGSTVEMLKSIIRERLQRHDYDVVGISSMYVYAHQWSHFIAAVVKENSRETPVVIGGGHPTLMIEETMEDANIDYCVEGEGEVTLLSLLHALNGGDFISLEEIGGLAYRHQGEVFVRDRDNYIWDLDSLPFPDWDIVGLERYIQMFNDTSLEKYGVSVPMVTERGCPYQCTFCNVSDSWGYSFRKRSPENVLAEVDVLINKYNVRDYVFVDDNMTIDKQRMLEICAGLKERNVVWQVVNMASFNSNEKIIRAMKESGCKKASISIESASPQVLKKMKKPVNLEKSLVLINECKKIGLPITANFVTGMHYETKEDMMMTFEWAEYAKPDWSTFSILAPYPGTEIFDQCVEEGYLNTDTVDLEWFSHRNSAIETDAWDKQWVTDKTYHYNLMINFVKNHNLVGDGKNLDFAIGFFEYVALHHKKHLLGLIALSYAMKKKGEEIKAGELLERALEIVDDPEVQEVFGPYLKMDEEIINYFLHWCEEREAAVA